MNHCPDDGACHHGCTSGCFRVAYCVPLSCFGEEWPPEIVASRGVYVGTDHVTEMIVRAPGADVTSGV